MPLADAAFQQGLAALREGREDEAIPLLRDSVARHPDHAGLWQVLGLNQRAAEDLSGAVTCFRQAARLAPHDKKIAQGLAQCLLEAGMPAVGAFEAAQRLAPADLEIAQGLIAAVAAEQGPVAAIARAKPLVEANPFWLAGHWLLSRLIGVSGSGEPVDQLIESVVRRHRGRADLWHHWLFTAMKRRDWPRALAVAEEAAATFLRDTSFVWLKAACLSECGDLAAATALYRQLGPIPDIGNGIYLCRHWLRTGKPELVSSLASQVSDPTLAEPLFPYFGLAWRLLDDPRLRWLEAPELVGVYDLTPDLPPLDELAAHLRTLHTQTEQPLEQSVRGGTQTDGPLLSRAEPVVRHLRRAIADAVRRHLDQLPAIDPKHPQLRHRRDRPIRFAGSWSVRLRGGGHHDQHIHPEGWFSSALYVALPPSIGGEEKAGWLTLGQPQDSLGLNLEPQRLIEPKPGRLVLFPSTMWHGTVPFSNGERLTVAFDVAPPRG